MSPLTSDNPHLSEPKMSNTITRTERAEGLPEQVRTYIREAVSDNTRRAYRADLSHFAAWGGTIPASPEIVASYPFFVPVLGR